MILGKKLCYFSVWCMLLFLELRSSDCCQPDYTVISLLGCEFLISFALSLSFFHFKFLSYGRLCKSELLVRYRNTELL